MEQTTDMPSLEILEAELQRLQAKKRRNGRIAGVLCGVATLLAVLVLVASLWLPIVQVYGSAMAPTLRSGDLLMAVPTGDYAPGDIIAFYHNNALQVRRVIAGPGSVVAISPEGVVRVDGTALKEPYLTGTALGQCDLIMPYTVPDGCWFVLGDDRAGSIDSRSSVMGCVSRERIAGEVFLRLWPLEDFGIIAEIG